MELSASLDRAPAASSIPAWAEDAVLDQAFESWTPGPPPGAPDAEWDAMGLVSPPRKPDAGAGVPTLVASERPSRWMRSDDDVLPPRRGSRWGRAAGWRRHP